MTAPDDRADTAPPAADTAPPAAEAGPSRPGREGVTRDSAPRNAVFWFRIAMTALIVTFPWAYAMVMFGVNAVFVGVGVALSGVITLLIWDGTRIARGVLDWLKGEAMRDSTSGLYNPEAWAELLASEEDRCARYELPASVVVVKVEVPAGKGLTEAGQKAGAAIRGVSRGHDIVACLAADTFSVLAINSKDPSAASLVERLRSAIEQQGLAASFSVASRQTSDTLMGAFEDARRGLVSQV